MKPSVFGIVYLLPTASTHIFIQKIYINISLSPTVEGGGLFRWNNQRTHTTAINFLT